MQVHRNPGRKMLGLLLALGAAFSIGVVATPVAAARSVSIEHKTTLFKSASSPEARLAACKTRSKQVTADAIKHAPPAGFSPATATDSQLAKQHMIPRPHDAYGLVAWQARAKHMKHYYVPHLTCSPAAPPVPTPPPDLIDSANGFAGYDLVASRVGQGGFAWTQSQWTVPTVPRNQGNGSSGVFAWPGLGCYASPGNSNAGVMQAGSASVAGTYGAYYYLWMADIGTGGTGPFDQNAGPPIRAGDPVYAGVAYNGNHTAYMQVANLRTEYYSTNWSFPTPYVELGNGCTVVEKIGFGIPGYVLPQFSDPNFTSVTLAGGNQVQYYLSPAWDRITPANNSMAAYATIPRNAIDVYWAHQ